MATQYLSSKLQGFDKDPELRDSITLGSYNMATWDAFNNRVSQFATILNLDEQVGFLEGAVGEIFQKTMEDEEWGDALKAADFLDTRQQ